MEGNMLMQLFSPLITSHNVMDEQFGNPYTSITCNDNTTICLQKFQDCVIILVGREPEYTLQRLINIVLRLVKVIMTNICF